VIVMMSERQRELIRVSFEHVRPIKERAGQLFYEELFVLAPGLAELFAGVSIMTQGGKLMQVLEYAVDHLDQWSALTAQLEQLGARHAGYRVRTDHYAAVGSALIATLKKALGEEFSEEVEEAWIEFYTNLSMTMEKGARDSVV
jgi:hemoglobin-like flavoprotein